MIIRQTAGYTGAYNSVAILVGLQETIKVLFQSHEARLVQIDNGANVHIWAYNETVDTKGD